VDVIVNELKNYSEEHCFKIIGCGICQNVAKLSDKLAPALWKELDVIPFVLEPGVDVDNEEKQRIADGAWGVDEEADSVVGHFRYQPLSGGVIDIFFRSEKP